MAGNYRQKAFASSSNSACTKKEGIHGWIPKAKFPVGERQVAHSKSQPHGKTCAPRLFIVALLLCPRGKLDPLTSSRRSSLTVSPGSSGCAAQRSGGNFAVSISADWPQEINPQIPMLQFCFRSHHARTFFDHNKKASAILAEHLNLCAGRHVQDAPSDQELDRHNAR